MSDLQRTEFKLTNSPTDGITSVKFGPNSAQFLLVSSWDCSVSMYDVINNNLRVRYLHTHPVLDCCFQDAVHAFSGGLDCQLKMYDLNTNSELYVGIHEKSIRCVEYSAEINCIITGSWDSMVKLWDPRNCNSIVGSLSQGERVYTMGLSGEKLVVGTAQRRVFIWDLRNHKYPQQKRDSSLKFQTRCIRCFPNRQGYVLSSIEGRVAVEYLDPSPEIQKKKYAFKCHRIKEDGNEKVFPVNAISHDGSVLAIGVSYQYEKMSEPENMPEDNVFIRYVTDQETKPK